MKKYKIEDNLSEKDLITIEKFLNEIEKNGYPNSTAFYGYPYFESSEKHIVLKCAVINQKGIFVLYDNEEEKKVYNRQIKIILLKSQELYDLMEEKELINFVDGTELDTFSSKIRDLDDILNAQMVRQMVAAFQNTFCLITPDHRNLIRDDSIGSSICKRLQEIANFDEIQFEGIYNKIDSHLRIRGLAGSGKTIVLVKKMAFLHFKYRNANLCYVFYTLSLKQYIQNLFTTFYKEFDQYGEPDWSKVHIVHCWGGKWNEGFYSMICKRMLIEPETYGISSSLESVSKSLLTSISTYSSLDMFNYVFLDEAQDFGINFYKLIFKSLSEHGKLFYAYDEMQSLSETNSTVPSKKEIFGSAKCEDINLKTCYRTPNEIIVTAHALGLGVYREAPVGKISIVNMIEDITVWKSIGYEVIEGKLEYGQYVKLTRNSSFASKIPDPIRVGAFENCEKEYEYVATEIVKLITTEEVEAEDILIIDLDYKNLQKNSSLFKDKFYSIFPKNDKKYYNDYEWKININVVNKDNPKMFKIINSIPYTTVYRAKGNEANIVFILNSDIMSSFNSVSRNTLFTAMTRSKFLVYILSGNNVTPYYEEVQKVKDNNYTLQFVYPTKDQMVEMRTNSKLEVSAANAFDNAIQSFNEARQFNKELELKLLLKQTGKKDINELVTYLEGLKESNESRED